MLPTCTAYSVLPSTLSSFPFLFFFFQAEDGIRDWSVTGVQTCALPIFDAERPTAVHRGRPFRVKPRTGSSRRAARSEERRVGKECRSRWSTYDEEKKIEDRTGGD